MAKKFLSLALAIIMISCFLVGCNHKGTQTEAGFTDKKTGIEYVYCKMLGVYAHGVEDEYINVGDEVFYKVEFEDPKEFLAVEDSGEFLLVRSKDTEEPTLSNFGPIAAEIYNSGNTVLISYIYASNEDLPEDKRYDENPENGYICKLMAQALAEREAQTVPDDEISDENRYFIRLLSDKYPGLYYVLVFFKDTSGRYYLYDRAAKKTVFSPREVTAFMVGEDG